MLFNSDIFVFVFLPLSLIVYYVFVQIRNFRSAVIWLGLASLFFYAWWNPVYVILLLSSIVINFFVGIGIAKTRIEQKKLSLLILIVGIAANLFALAYYKYTGFFLLNFNVITGTTLPIINVLLPLGISFFTFTQTTYLVDTYKGAADEYDFPSYVLFVTFFPHLIAGPILHHSEMMPQFRDRATFVMNWESLCKGLVIFIVGLLKKVIIADQLSKYASPIFALSSLGKHLTIFEAWAGALAYTLQLYFDFSGYSEMAIGLALMFNIKLPINFFSPYKSKSIIEFWRRWHITLSRFLRDYLYIPLGGNRKGPFRRYLNLMITMFLAGLWHGAGWTFVVWGCLHGVYLMINNLWREMSRKWGIQLGSGFSWCLTFLSVVVAWVFFRAHNMNSAIEIIKTMFGFYGLHPSLTPNVGIPASNMIFSVIGAMLVAVVLPNIIELIEYRPVIDVDKKIVGTQFHKYLQWRPSRVWAFLLGVALLLCILGFRQTSEFLYFQF